MRRLVVSAFACLLLAACSETRTDGDACATFTDVVAEIEAYTPGGSYEDHEVENQRQWEFRLARASVDATDHDLSDQLRSIAYTASRVVEGTADDKEAFLTEAEPIAQVCN